MCNSLFYSKWIEDTVQMRNNIRENVIDGSSHYFLTSTSFRFYASDRSHIIDILILFCTI